MADLILDWALLGAYGTEISGPTSVDTGGVSVGIDFTSKDAGAQAFTFISDGYFAAGEPFDPASHLKLFGEGGDGGGMSPTSTTVLDFSSSDPLFGDSVQNVAFRLNDVDAGAGGDLDEVGPGDWLDNLTILAYDASGTLIPVTLTAASAATTVSGTTVTGTTVSPFNGADGSVLVEIAGPVARIEFVYENGGVNQQGVLISDIHFSTIDTEGENDAPVAVDDTIVGTEGADIIVNVLGNDSDPNGDTLTVTGTTPPANGSVVVNGDGTVTYTPNAGFTGTDTFDYTIDDGNGGTDTGTVTVTVNPDNGTGPDGYVDGTGGDDLIYTNTPTDRYTGDPNGDFVDSNDALLPGEVGEDDIIRADDGNDTVYAGAGDDEVIAGTGDDSVEGGAGDDSLIGEEGNDTLLGGDGADTARGGDHDDYIDTSATTGPRIDTDVFPVVAALQAIDPLNGLDEDPDPNDDRDYVDGGAGNDTILTGDDADTIEGGAGDDVIEAGIDDDLVFGNTGNDSITDIQGSDTIDGGAGDDTIIAGVDTFSDYPDTPGNPILTPLGFDRDPNPDDGKDSVMGGLGNDLIMTGDDDDTIDGGADNDTIDAGIDDDLVYGATGDDSLIGGHGSDTIDGGQGDDFIDGSAPAAYELTDDVDPNPDNDRDLLVGALGNDTILGGDDDDTLIGGSGNDLLDGGIDDDSIQGGADDDTIIGGAGADTMDGGADQDTFIIGSVEDGIGDVIAGNSTGVDFDTLDLSGLPAGSWRLADTRTDSDGNGLDGTVEFLDPASGAVVGSATFTNIELVVPCFTPGTRIATPIGERLVEELKVGDRIITRDNGIQEIRWIGNKKLTGHELARAPHLRPILIQAGSLGPNLPEHDMLVSPNHRVLVSNDKTALYFEEREVLAAAKHLTGMKGIDEVGTLGVNYIHFMFDQHEVVLSNGAWTESFQPGQQTLDGIGNAQRTELLELFPELSTPAGVDGYAAARRSLKKHEARLLVK